MFESSDVVACEDELGGQAYEDVEDSQGLHLDVEVNAYGILFVEVYGLMRHNSSCEGLSSSAAWTINCFREPIPYHVLKVVWNHRVKRYMECRESRSRNRNPGLQGLHCLLKLQTCRLFPGIMATRLLKAEQTFAALDRGAGLARG
jgi:hypothetical protein